MATSTDVVRKLGELLHRRGVEARIETCKASEIESKIALYDLVVSTTEVADPKGKPVIHTVSFLTGIGVDRDIERIAKILEA